MAEHQVTFFVFFVIEGPVLINPNFDPRAAEFKNLSVVHVWGMNFENRFTHDYEKHVVAHENKVRKPPPCGKCVLLIIK